MPNSPCVTQFSDADSLREQLMHADPMHRAMALHAVEMEVEHCAASDRVALRHEAARFTARGIPYYSLQDPYFQDWVGRAVSYWERLHAAKSKLASPPPPRRRKSTGVASAGRKA